MHERALAGAIEFLDSWLAFRARNTDSCGFKVAIHYESDIVLARSFGHADIALPEPLGQHHVMGVGSQSKMLASTVVCQLVERDRLHFDDRVCRYLPWLARHPDPRARDITVRHLLAHSSGLARNGADADCWNFAKPFPDAGMVQEVVFDTDIVVGTNTRLKYSNVGFGILGALIEAVTGKPYADVVTAEVIERVGMSSTSADFGPGVATRLAPSYTPRIEGNRRALPPPESTGALVAATGLWSTPEDMCRFASAHYAGCDALLSDTLKREAHRGQWVITSGQDRGVEMGLGFHAIFVDGRRYVGHGGSIGGYRSETLFDPDARLAVSIMANWADAPSMAMIRGVLQVLHYFEEHGADPVPAGRRRFNARLRNAVATVEIVATNDRAVAIDPDRWEPFTVTEQLTVVDPETLRVSTVGSHFNEGESFRYAFDGPTLRSVKFAGFTMLPERDFVRTVKLTGRAGSSHRPVDEPAHAGR